MNKLFLFTCLILFSVGCATSLVTIESDPPGADVYLSKSGEVPSKVGQTPFVLPAQLADLKKEPILVSIDKSGYKRESALLPAASLGQNAKIGFFLKEDMAQKSSTSSDDSLEEMAKGVAQIQESIRMREFDTALNSINTLLAKYKNIATLHGLQGNIYYLQKNIEKALVSYKRATALVPNSETEKLIHKLESFRGGGSQ